MSSFSVDKLNSNVNLVENSEMMLINGRRDKDGAPAFFLPSPNHTTQVKIGKKEGECVAESAEKGKAVAVAYDVTYLVSKRE